MLGSFPRNSTPASFGNFTRNYWNRNDIDIDGSTDRTLRALISGRRRQRRSLSTRFRLISHFRGLASVMPIFKIRYIGALYNCNDYPTYETSARRVTIRGGNNLYSTQIIIGGILYLPTDPLSSSRNYTIIILLRHIQQRLRSSSDHSRAWYSIRKRFLYTSHNHGHTLPPRVFRHDVHNTI